MTAAASAKAAPAAQSSPGRGAPKRLLVLGLLFHLVYIASVFDIYFVSPVVHVDKRYGPLDGLDGRPPADRVVLIVGDGLRADKLFQLYADPPFRDAKQASSLPEVDLPSGQTTPAPYLRSRITQGKAAWGVSHTRVPTESRPGHVAMIAGMYEDVSAVTKGWKANPVGFDSVLNQSSHAWGFGSPDIVPMFADGATPGKVDMWCYEASDEDFTADASTLDTWVLDRVEGLFADASATPALAAQMRRPGVVFFLHLLGLDTTGHAYRPHGVEYYNNIVIVDDIVRRVEELFDEFYERDGRTSYVFTADHGMSNIGNHGDGDPDSTRTPLIVWGAGVEPAGNEQGDHDAYSAPWGLDGARRQDVEQADVAALMAAMGGRPFPGNSVGRLPRSYLDVSPRYEAEAAFSNALGILEQYEVKNADLASRKLAFKPFRHLAAAAPGQLDLSSSARVTRIRSLIDDQRYDIALRGCSDLVDIALEGLRYLQTYDWLVLRIIVVTGYLGWMALAANFVLRHYASAALPTQSSASLVPSMVCAAAFAAAAAVFARERAPLTYYLYAAFPALFWFEILSTGRPLITAARSSLRSPSRIVLLLALIGALELAVIGYFRRQAWTLGFILLGVVAPVFTTPTSFRQKSENRQLAVAWAISCMITGAFTLLPVEKGESLLTISAGALLFIVAGTAAAVGARQPVPRLGPWRQPSEAESKKRAAEERERADLSRILVFQTCACTVSLAVTLTSAMSLQAKRGLTLRSQLAGWLVLVMSSFSPFVSLRYVHTPMNRLVVLIGSFAPVMIILSISYETLFYFCFSFTLLLWLVFERRVAEHVAQSRAAKTLGRIDASHLRIALAFLHFIHVGFFGTGNVASVSSFYLEPVYRLIPIFDPFSMGALLIYKILIPFTIVSAVFSALHAALGLPPFSLFLTALTLSDILTLNFFFLVRDEGSWLDIGQSISHFCIASALIVFMFGLHLAGERLMRPPG